MILILVLIGMLAVVMYPKQREAEGKSSDGIIKIAYMKCDIKDNNIIIKLTVINKTYITIQNATIRIKAWSGSDSQEVAIPVKRWNVMEPRKYNKKLPARIKSIDACAIKVFGSDGGQFDVAYW